MGMEGIWNNEDHIEVHSFPDTYKANAESTPDPPKAPKRPASIGFGEEIILSLYRESWFERGLKQSGRAGKGGVEGGEEERALGGREVAKRFWGRAEEKKRLEEIGRLGGVGEIREARRGWRRKGRGSGI